MSFIYIVYIDPIYQQLLEMYNGILNSLEKKEISCFVFCDFSTEFGIKGCCTTLNHTV